MITNSSDYYDNGERVVKHVRWTITTGEVTFRCLNCGAREEVDVLRLSDIREPERMLYAFTAKHKDCKYEPV